MASPHPPSRRRPLHIAEVGIGGMVNGKDLQVVPVPHQHQPHGHVPNPLLIDVVLDNLFGYLDFEDLSTCRRVSKQWHSLSLPHWLRTGPPLTLHLAPERSSTSHKKLTVSKFLQLVDNDELPYCYGPHHPHEEYAGLRQCTNFAVEGDLGIGIQHQFLRLFLQTWGHRLAKLSLSLRIPDVETLATLLLFSSSAVMMSPNLFKLEVDLSCCCAEEEDSNNNNNHLEVTSALGLKKVEQESSKGVTMSLQIDDGIESLPAIGWISLLVRYPNLQMICVKGIGNSKGASNCKTRLEAIWHIRQGDKKKVLNLKQVEIIICCRSQIDNQQPASSLVHLIRDSQLALETLNQTMHDLLDCRHQAAKIHHFHAVLLQLPKKLVEKLDDISSLLHLGLELTPTLLGRRLKERILRALGSIWQRGGGGHARDQRLMTTN